MSVMKGRDCALPQGAPLGFREVTTPLMETQHTANCVPPPKRGTVSEHAPNHRAVGCDTGLGCPSANTDPTICPP